MSTIELHRAHSAQAFLKKQMDGILGDKGLVGKEYVQQHDKLGVDLPRNWKK